MKSCRDGRGMCHPVPVTAGTDTVIIIDEDHIAEILQSQGNLAKDVQRLLDQYKYEIITLQNLLSALRDSVNGRKLLKELNFHNYEVRYINGRQYIVLKGYAGLRPTLKGTIYGVNNPKVLELGIGPYGKAGIGNAAQVKNLLRGNIVFVLLVTTPFNVAEHLIGDEKAWQLFFIEQSMDVAISLIATVAGGLAAGVAVAFSAPVVAVVAVAVGVSFVVGFGLSTLAEYLNLSQELSDLIDDFARMFERPVTAEDFCRLELRAARSQLQCDPMHLRRLPDEAFFENATMLEALMGPQATYSVCNKIRR